MSSFTCEDAITFISESRTVGYAVVDVDFKFVKVNEAYCRFLNAVPQLVIGSTFMKWTHPDDLQIDLENAKELIAGTKFEYALAKRYIQHGSTPKAIREIWGLLEVKAVWKEGTFSCFMVTFTPWTQSEKTGIGTYLTYPLLKDSLKWAASNWKIVAMIAGVSISMIWGGSGKLQSFLQEVQQAKDSMDSILEPNDSSGQSGLPEPLLP